MKHNLWVINTYLFRRDDHSDGRIFKNYNTMRMCHMDDLDNLDIIDNLEHKEEISRSQQRWSTTSGLKIVNDFFHQFSIIGKFYSTESVQLTVSINYTFYLIIFVKVSMVIFLPLLFHHTQKIDAFQNLPKWLIKWIHQKDKQTLSSKKTTTR